MDPAHLGDGHHAGALPGGIGRAVFYQKHTATGRPSRCGACASRRRRRPAVLVVDDLAALVGWCSRILEIHTGTRVRAPRRRTASSRPRPGHDVAWPRVIEAARRIRARLQALGLASFVKTTGGKACTWSRHRAESTGRVCRFRERHREELAHDDPRASWPRCRKRSARADLHRLAANVRGRPRSPPIPRAKPERRARSLLWDELERGWPRPFQVEKLLRRLRP